MSPPALPHSPFDMHKHTVADAKADLETGAPPARGVAVSWVNVSYSVGSARAPLTLLHSVTGCLRPGTLTVLMGPSGSSKTTLLDVLAGRKTVGRISGDVRFAGAPPTRAFLRRATGYVEQADTLLPHLTVAEMLTYTADMLLAPGPDREDRVKERVATVLAQLDLTGCANVRIGCELRRGVSGGQRKRVSVGCALVGDPRVLFLDEPTSGLDSYTAARVLAVVRRLAIDDGLTVCTTVHSPPAAAFDAVDSVVILLRGRVVYAGTGAGGTAAAGAVAHFKELGLVTASLHVDAGHAAEWLVAVTTQADHDGRAADLAKAFAATPAATAVQDAAAEAAKPPAAVDVGLAADLACRKAAASSSAAAWWRLMRHRGRRDLINPSFLGPRVADKVFLVAILVSLYWKFASKPSIGAVTNVSAFLFTWIILPVFCACTLMPSLVLERAIFVRERADGLYSVTAYLGYKLFVELVVATLTSLPVTAAMFLGAALHGSYAYFWLVFLFSLAVGVAAGYLVAAASPTMDVANAALPTWACVNLFFVGQLIRFDDMPRGWRWYSWLDPMRYGWAGLLVNEEASSPLPLYITGKRLTVFYGVNNTNKWSVLGALASFVAVFVVATWATLRFKRLTQR